MLFFDHLCRSTNSTCTDVLAQLGGSSANHTLGYSWVDWLALVSSTFLSPGWRVRWVSLGETPASLTHRHGPAPLATRSSGTGGLCSRACREICEYDPHVPNRAHRGLFAHRCVFRSHFGLCRTLFGEFAACGVCSIFFTDVVAALRWGPVAIRPSVLSPVGEAARVTQVSLAAVSHEILCFLRAHTIGP